MVLNRNQVSHMQQAAWKLQESIDSMKKAGFNNSTPIVRKMRAGLDELNYSLDTYTLEPEQKSSK